MLDLEELSVKVGKQLLLHRCQSKSHVYLELSTADPEFLGTRPTIITPTKIGEMQLVGSGAMCGR